jgi:isocitrate dehydrogenase
VTRHFRAYEKARDEALKERVSKEEAETRGVAATSTNSIASIFAWTRGLAHRGKLDGTPELTRFSQTLEATVIKTVEAGYMTKDLAVLVGDEQTWLSTAEFLDKVDEYFRKALAA